MRWIWLRLALVAMAAATAAAVDCITDTGKTLALGKERMHRDNRTCTISRCLADGLKTVLVECPAPQCLKAVRKGDACCYSCPSGENCLLPGTQTVIDKKRQYRNATHLCMCPVIRGLGWDQDVLTAQCLQIPSTTPAPNCLFNLTVANVTNDLVLGPGESSIQLTSNVCVKYTCDTFGAPRTFYLSCPKPTCKQPVLHPGACCPVCNKDEDGVPLTSLQTGLKKAAGHAWVAFNYVTRIWDVIQPMFKGPADCKKGPGFSGLLGMLGINIPAAKPKQGIKQTQKEATQKVVVIVDDDDDVNQDTDQGDDDDTNANDDVDNDPKQGRGEKPPAMSKPKAQAKKDADPFASLLAWSMSMMSKLGSMFSQEKKTAGKQTYT